MKRIAALFLSLALVLSFVTTTTAQAETKPISIWVEDGQVQLGEHSPINEKGTTLVPAEPLLDELNFDVKWDAKEETITGTKEGLVISLEVGKATATVNGAEKALLQAPKLIKDVAYVPVRFIGEAAGYEVLWNSELRTITVKAKAESKGFLWKAENAGNTVYLLGSIHVANETMYPLSSKIEQAYADSDFLVVEADITKAADPASQQLVQDMSVYKDGSTLKDHISADSYKKLEAILKENGLQPGVFDTLKPWSVASALDYLTVMKSGFDSDIGIDMHFLTKAVESKLPILELESIQFQIEMLDQFSPELQEEMLAGSITGYYSTSVGIEDLSAMWVTGNDKELITITNAMSTNEEYYKAMLIDRNGPMVEKIEGYLNGKENKTYLVVVGAAHMLGEYGIVPALEKKGFTVTRQ